MAVRKQHLEGGSQMVFKRKRHVLILALTLSVLLIGMITGCSSEKRRERASLDLSEPQAIMAEHATLFEKRIEKVTDGIYVAVGYALANVIFIETDEGLVIIDTTESVDAAREIKEDFAEITDAPTRAIIYTHAHPDHIYGSPVFAEDTAENFEVYAQAKHFDFFREQLLLRDILNMRGIRQFGSKLPDEYFIVHGLGPVLRYDHTRYAGYIAPTVLFDDELHLSIGGQEIVLIHAPGETEDQLMAWMPEKRVLFPGDNYYPAFPNLYTIRGSAPRDVSHWISSLDMMRACQAEYLVPSHAGPITGAARIDELLTAYRDAIQYVHDAVIRGANQGKTPDELVAEIKLPPHLTKHPELLELYGQVSFSIRSMYDRYLGWFDGNATNLEPLPYWERAEKISEMVGGTDKLIREAEKALKDGEHQWAAELADMIIAVEPANNKGREIKIEALLQLGEATYNTNARHYYFTQALEMAGIIELPKDPVIEPEAAHAIPIEDLFITMAVSLDPVAGADQTMAVTFNISDTGEVYTIKVRRGVAELSREAYEDADVIVHVEENVWKELATGSTGPVAALLGGGLKVEGFKLITLSRFLDLFGGS